MYADSGSWYHKRRAYLLEQRMRNGDDNGLYDVGVSFDNALDLTRIDVVSAGLVHVRVTSNQSESSVR